MTDRLLPANFSGATVLEIGCGDGFFCLEAKKRSARRVVAVDTDEERLAAAALLARQRHLDVDYLRGGIEDCKELGRFDYVVCRQLPQATRDPILAIHRLIDLAGKMLIMQFDDVDLRVVKFSRKTARRGLLGAWRPLFHLLPPRLRPAILTVDSHGKFLMTGNWVKNLLRGQRRDVERVEIFASDQSHRYFARATMRRLSLLLLLSGPAGIGKSNLARSLIPNDAELRRLVGLGEGVDCQTMGDVAIDEGKEIKSTRLVLEYNIWRPVEREWDGYDADPVLTLMRVADAKRVCLLVTSKEIVIERLRTRQGDAKVEWLTREYSLPGRFRKIYERWIDHCKAKGCEISYLDVGASRVTSVSEDEALKIVGCG